mmetsp:Transcript_22558/g.53550  ORF Transcript_22558/g.53550 Transcript_22558/m.53550 type:complete len:897 (+) Transcript_22558:208-2898(+)|eukprot:CAMPEP_0197180076 /NCGR_PEP_ID=MMETSP1423-20130617/4816_1 /TAXON_ID=476441 /ORGANISM="Pseudo-nitzschia heimii, Strain UNC1101" /LENGTH=896 /DNA_ID=CAMNT_0042630097 /DNA_START=119 /DNA_END=2809 /DNA_ORIENTATION=+
MAPSANDNPQAGQGRPLPKKENDLFKNVVKHYEQKQYKKAIKQADSILKKYPNHGETLCMKGLVLNNMGKKEEAHALVKQGLMYDMRSHVCWHVFGLLHRGDRNYNEAIKAYKQALRIDCDNLQILRDLSLLQIQMRDLSGFAVTRHNILNLKSNGKINWLAFALAKHLMGDLRGAISVIDIYLGTLSDESTEKARGFEASELALYKNRILAEIPNNYREALDHLNACEKVVVDRTSLLVTRAIYQYKLGHFADARTTIMDVFDRGLIEDYKIHSLFMCATLEIDNEIMDATLQLHGTRTLASMIHLTNEQKEKLLEAYKTEIYPKYQKSKAAVRIPMNLVDGERFRNSLDIYIRKGLVKGVPSLCKELSSFLLIEKDGKYDVANDPLDVKNHPTYGLICELVDGYISTLKSVNKLLPDDEFEEPPSTELWAFYLRAGLHELSAQYSEGIALLDKCLEHTPTAVDAYELKARLIKAAGDIKFAVEVLDQGRDLDRQDRYINNQTTKYMLEAGMEKEALERISMFTKHEGNPEVNLYEMQCSWYELGLGSCFAEKKEWGKSLKKYSAVVKHFDDFHEDQFDFHSYCIRKVTLRAYTDVLKFEDNLWGEDYYFTAAEGISRIYLMLFDNPEITKQDEGPDYSKMTAAQRKKAKAIARKKRAQAEKKEAAAKKKKEQEAAENGDQKNAPKKGSKPSFIDEDPNGKELLKANPLEEAKKYSAILSKHCSKRLGTWALQYDVSIRRKKLMLALQALLRLKTIDAKSPEYVSRTVDFALKVSNFVMSGAVKNVVTKECTNLLNGASVANLVKELAVEARSDPTTPLPLRIVIAKSLVSTKSEPVEKAASVIVDSGTEMRGFDVQSCRLALTALKDFGSEASTAVEKWKALVTERYPLAKYFS